MKFKTILLISFLIVINLNAFGPQKNANRAKINCMFISKKLKANGQKMTGSNAK